VGRLTERPNFGKSDWVGTEPRGPIEGRLPERVFWDDVGQNRRFWLKNPDAVRKEVAALYIVILLPAALADAVQLDKGEQLEWFVEDKNTLILRRKNPAKPLKLQH
jgi:hypothetical protein